MHYVRSNAITNEYFKDNLRPSCRGVVKKVSKVREAFASAKAHKFRPLERVEEDELIIYDTPQEIDLVIVDEAHHYPARTWYNIINHFTNAKKLFMTATPTYNNGPILIDPNIINFQETSTCYSISRQTLIALIALNRIIRPVRFDQTIAINDDFERACKVNIFSN